MLLVSAVVCVLYGPLLLIKHVENSSDRNATWGSRHSARIIHIRFEMKCPRGSKIHIICYYFAI
jgi:hypothetical protein